MKPEILGPLCVGLVVLAAAAFPAPSPAEVDPFYASRFHEGRAAYDRGDHQEAAFSLRLACFGMLEAPEELTECLVWLALAQVGADDREGFAATFRRLMEGEDLVGLYSGSHLPPDLQSAFEARALEWIPEATLAAIPAFSELVYRREEQRLAGLSPRARRAQLGDLMRDRPREARWPAVLARLEEEEGRPQAALEAAERALELAPENAEAQCVRGWALARLGRCPEAVGSLDRCSRQALSYASEALRCHVEAEEWALAQWLLAEMEPSWRQTPAVARIAEQIEGRGQDPAPSASQSPPPPPSVVSLEPLTPSEEGPDPLPGAAQERLERARELAAAARTRQELDEAYRLSLEIVETYPDSRSARLLAAEIAYRASRWPEAVAHFREAGPHGTDQPELAFYFAVSLYESGERAEAAEVLRCCADRLRSTPFVEQYVRRILGEP